MKALVLTLLAAALLAGSALGGSIVWTDAPVGDSIIWGN
jgi:hypothetical protein